MVKTPLCCDVEACRPIVAFLVPNALLFETSEYVDVPVIGCVIETVVPLPVLAIDLRSWCTEHQVDNVHTKLVRHATNNDLLSLSTCEHKWAHLFR